MILEDNASLVDVNGRLTETNRWRTTRRNFENELTLFPGGRIMPYLGYSRNSDSGNGITTLVAEMNESPLRNLITWG